MVKITYVPLRNNYRPNRAIDSFYKYERWRGFKRMHTQIKSECTHTLCGPWVAFAVCFGSLSTCTMKCRLINVAALDWIWADSISLYTSELIRLLLSSVSSLNTSKPEPLEAIHAHASRSCITLLHVSQMMLCAFGLMSCSKPSPDFFLPVILILISAVQRMLFQKWCGFFRCFLAKSNQALFAACGEASVCALVKSSLDSLEYVLVSS